MGEIWSEELRRGIQAHLNTSGLKKSDKGF